MNRPLPALFISLSALAIQFACPVRGRAQDDHADRIRQLDDLVVVVRSHLNDEDKIGTGLIFGASATRLYIVTANHNVRTGATDASTVSLQFKWQPSQRLNATLLDNSDHDLDVAVLSVEAPESLPILHYDILGDPAVLQAGDDVYTLGHPNGNLWQINMKPDAVSSERADRVLFQSTFLAPGHSGGLLLDKERRVVGMILSDQPPHGEARTIDRVLEWLAQFDYPIELSSPGTPSNLSQFESTIREDVLYDCSALGSWPSSDVKPEAILAHLLGLLKRVEGEPRYRSSKSTLIADLYRCTGGANLIVEGELWDKIPKALPYLHHSIDANPAQPLLKQNVAYLETFLQAHQGNIREYMTNCLQILRGNDESNIASIVDQMMKAVASPEFQAKQWLMKDATPNPPLETWLEVISLRIKRELNKDAPVEVTSSELPGGLVEVKATVGPNVFVWDVDFAKKTYVPRNKATEDFMTMVEKPRK